MRRSFLFCNRVNHKAFCKVVESAKAIISNVKIDQKPSKLHESKINLFNKKEHNQNQNRVTSESEGKKVFDDDIACSQ